MIPVERHDVLVQKKSAGFRLFAVMEQTESVAAVGIDDSVQCDFAHALQATGKRCVRTQQFPRLSTLDVSLSETRIVFLQQLDQLPIELESIFQMAFFQRVKPFAACLQALFGQDVLHRHC